MNTQHTDMGQEPQPSGEDPGSIRTQDSVQEQSVAPTFPQPPLPKSNRRFVWIATTISLVLILSMGVVLAQLAQRPGPQGTPTPTPKATVVPTTTPSGGDTTPTPAPGVILGPQACPAAVKDPAHWAAIVGTQSGTTKVENVTCANMLGNPSLQALVTVRHSGADGVLDVYVYNNITDPKPEQIFKLAGLIRGVTRISGYNTVMTGEADVHSSVNQNIPSRPVVVDLFREFEWNDGEGTFVQVAFPGIFPDLTRYQAEADQALVNQGQETWKNDPAQVARTMAVKLLKWSPNTQTTVLRGGGLEDVDAVVQVRSTSPGHPAIKVTLSRLEGNTANMWVVIGVRTDGMSITAPQNRDRLTSPVTVTGTGSAFEAQVGIVYVFDHLSTDIGHAEARGAQGMGPTTFTTKVSYNASFHGVQEGMVALYSYSAADGSIAGVVILKELISG